MAAVKGERVRWSLVAVGLALMAGGCGGSEMSMTDYVDEINEIVLAASQQYEATVSSEQGAVLTASGAALGDYAPQDLQSALVLVRQIEADVEEAVSRVEPPEQILDIHLLMFDFDDGFISAQEALAVRAGTATSWEELSESAEMLAYREALAEDKRKCVATESTLNDIADQREVFADTPWMPRDLKDIFDLILGCSGYPPHPEDVYRP